MHLRRGPRRTRASWSCFGGTGAARQRHRGATDGGGGIPLPRSWLSRNGTPVHQPSHGAGSFLPPDGLRPERCRGAAGDVPHQGPLPFCADDQAVVTGVGEIMKPIGDASAVPRRKCGSGDLIAFHSRRWGTFSTTAVTSSWRLDPVRNVCKRACRKSKDAVAVLVQHCSQAACICASEKSMPAVFRASCRPSVANSTPSPGESWMMCWS